MKVTREQMKILAAACEVLMDIVPEEEKENFAFESNPAYKAWDAIQDVIISAIREA